MVKKFYAILGSTGFIGKNLIEYFNLNGSNSIFSNTMQSNLLTKEGRDEIYNTIYYASGPFNVQEKSIIINAAAVTSGANDIVNKPYLHVTDNVVMNAQFLQELYENGGHRGSYISHYIFFSCTVMYPQNLGRPVKENDFTGEIYDKYFGVGWTKVYIEKLIEFYSKLMPETKFTIIRHSNVYGPHDKFDLQKSHMFGATMNKVFSAEEGGVVNVWGDGTEERDLIYVEDLMDFVDCVIKNQKTNFEIVNVGSGTTYSVDEIVNKIIKGTKKNLTIKHELGKPSLKNKLSLDITKAKEMYGWNPKYSLEEGIAKTINWLQKKAVNS